MATVSNIRLLKNAGVLAERKATNNSLDLKKYNLFYGFNGAGKSTLSRIFASLQQGAKHARLPNNCTFEIEMSDGSRYSCPKSLAGLEKRICVFNHDFVAENLRWEAGQANPIFYIGADQADAAERLKAKEAELPVKQTALQGEKKVLAEREKAFGEFKKQLARQVSERLRQSARYEAAQLAADFAKATTEQDRLEDVDLDAATTTSARSDPPAKVHHVGVPSRGILASCIAALELAPKSIGSVVITRLDDHPEMVPWVRHGHDYHAGHDLDECLFCGSSITQERRDLLSRAFDDEMNSYVQSLSSAVDQADNATGDLDVATAAIPAAAQLSAEFQPTFEAAAIRLLRSLEEVRPLLAGASNALKARKSTPTSPIEVKLPSIEKIRRCVDLLESYCNDVNAIIAQHATMVDDFHGHQTTARNAIRRHFVAVNKDAYVAQQTGLAEAEASQKSAQEAFDGLNTEIRELRTLVQQHGPAADKINSLVKSYLGHSELTIVATAEGYELHRHGRIVEGMPSEGEKTAIALCYFLSTLEAEDRRIGNLVVVVDDPVSSLDTKAMNYACGLIRNRLDKAAQVVVLTHNQQCLNEFRKAWKGKTRSAPPLARLLYVDVVVPEKTGTRSATIVELPKQLREYDSEYHFLFQKVMQYEAAGTGHFEYAFMMPNVLRRVMEVFLAFKVPRDGNLNDKLATVCDRHQSLNRDRLNALERLSQVESHSDNLDDLITLSSMTIEESRDANAALLYLMHEVDGAHLSDLRRHCAP